MLRRSWWLRAMMLSSALLSPLLLPQALQPALHHELAPLSLLPARIRCCSPFPCSSSGPSSSRSLHHHRSSCHCVLAGPGPGFQGRRSRTGRLATSGSHHRRTLTFHPCGALGHSRGPTPPGAGGPHSRGRGSRSSRPRVAASCRQLWGARPSWPGLRWRAATGRGCLQAHTLQGHPCLGAVADPLFSRVLSPAYAGIPGEGSNWRPREAAALGWVTPRAPEGVRVEVGVAHHPRLPAAGALRQGLGQ